MTQDPELPAQEWQAALERVCDLVEHADPADLERPVPATPDWSVRDLLAHVVGLDVDALAGREPDDHGAEWTQSHVDRRREHSVEEVLAEWRAVVPAMLAHLHDDPRPLGDVIIHEQDLRGALRAPGARSTPGLAQVRDQMAERLATRLAEKAESGDGPSAPVLLEGDDWSWRSDHDSDHDSDDQSDNEPGVVLRASTFDLARALTTRRSERQLRSYVTAGDVGPYLPAFAGLGPLPEHDQAE